MSHTIGSFLTTSAGQACTIGVGWDADNRIVNNIGYSLMVGFNSDEPTLFVGPSSGTGTTGKVGIATTSPTAKVHIIQTSLTDDAFRVDDEDYINENTPFVIDKDGNVGIGIASPRTKLHIAGDVAFGAGSTLTPNGNDEITVTHSYHSISTASGNDALDTINGGSVAGEILILSTTGGNTLTVIDNDNINGNNIKLDSSTNFTMGDDDTLTLLYDGTYYWLELSKSNN